MPFCSKCGAELSEDAVFCPKCGTPVHAAGVVYRRDTGWHVGRVFAVIFGGLMLLVAFGLLMGGGAILWTQTAITDQGGYMMTGPAHLNVASYAIVQSGVDVNMGGSWMMNPSSRDIVSVKISATSNNGKPVFVGIATQQYAQGYLNNVNVDKLISYEWVPNGMMGSGAPIYQTIPGGAPSSAPTAQVFWVAQASGTGTQTVTWTPTTGEYWVVIMNADGSQAVNVDAQVGARVTVLSWVGWGLLFGGLILAFGGIAAVYFGAFRRP
ncbi:MAG: zinc ribbon domain-containing protein [Candidatus Bathyarchaeota archaeon]|nr:zinc ribbon domain-containing protein [Candidatus Bathyarchaeota archaeon]